MTFDSRIGPNGREDDLTSALRKVKRLRLGRLTVKVVANDAAGNRSTTRSAALKVVA